LKAELASTSVWVTVEVTRRYRNKYGKDRIVRKERIVINKELKDYLDALKRGKASEIVLSNLGIDKFIIRFYKSEKYRDLRKGMFFIYKANWPRKLVLGAFTGLNGLRAELERLKKRYGWVAFATLYGDEDEANQLAGVGERSKAQA